MLHSASHDNSGFIGFKYESCGNSSRSILGCYESSYNNSWIFGRAFYVTCMVFMWGLSIAISSPMIEFYTQMEVYVVDTTGNNLTIKDSFVEMCAFKRVCG